MKRKIVSGVPKYRQQKDDGEVVDCLKVHYTDGTSKEHDHAEHIEELYNIIVKKTEIKDALNDVKTTYFKSVPQGHVPDEKKNS